MDDVARFHAGDREYFRSLVVEYGPRILRLARAFTPDATAADDLFQEIWMKVWERREQYAGGGSLGGWLQTLARRECVSHYRRERSARARVEVHRLASIAGGETRSSATGSLRLERAELRARLLEALAVLPERQRAAVELRLLQGLPAAEAAASMGCTPATVRSLLRNGLARLRTLLRDLTEDEHGMP